MVAAFSSREGLVVASVGENLPVVGFVFTPRQRTRAQQEQGQVSLGKLAPGFLENQSNHELCRRFGVTGARGGGAVLWEGGVTTKKRRALPKKKSNCHSSVPLHHTRPSPARTLRPAARY
jgi:hypothetical protein